MSDQLNARERTFLEFERLRWKYLGAKEAEVLERFGISLTRYAQIIDALIDRPASVTYDPTTVRRLLRLREQRQRARA